MAPQVAWGGGEAACGTWSRLGKGLRRGLFGTRRDLGVGWERNGDGVRVAMVWGLGMGA